MPLQARKYTTAQRDALVNAVLDQGMSQLEALRRAEHGELAGMKAFGPVARGTLQGWLRQAMKTRKRTVDTSPAELREKLLAELWEEVELTIPTLKGAEKIARIRQAATAIDALEKKPTRAGKPPKDGGDDGKPDSPGPEEEKPEAPSLQRLARAAATTAQSDPKDIEPDEGTEQPSVALDQSDQDRQSGDGVEGGRGIGHAHGSESDHEHDQVAAIATVSP